MIKKNLSKKFKKHFIKKGFSLVEIAIVLLIVGILISGITTYSRLVKQMKLSAVKHITASSPVPAVKGLALWLETTMDGSVTGAVNPLSPDDNEKIVSWNDINPQSQSRIIVSQNTDSLRPIYTTLGTINDLPAIKFSGGQFLQSLKSITGNVPLTQGDDSFTMIAVWQTNVNSGTNQAILDQNSTSTSQPAGNRAGMLLTIGGTYGFCGEAVDYLNCQQYQTKTPYISVITVANNGDVKIFTNSVTPQCSSSISSNALNISDQGFFVGVKGTNNAIEFMNGLIQEAIIYDRVISDDEVRDIVRYLAKKFNIKVT